MKEYILYEEVGLCLQDNNAKIYEAKDPKKMLAKLFIEELCGKMCDLDEDETGEVINEIKCAILNNEWDQISLDGELTDRNGKTVSYTVNPDKCTIDIPDMYDTRMIYSIVHGEESDENYNILLPSLDEMREFIDENWDELGYGEKMSRKEAATYLGHSVSNMTKEEIDEEVSEIQKAYYTEGAVAGASDEDVRKMYMQMNEAITKGM